MRVMLRSGENLESPLIVSMDVAYGSGVGPGEAYAAAVLFKGWKAQRPIGRVRVRIEDVIEYVPGQFHQRELPCLLKALEWLPEPPDVIIVDGYVWLDAEETPGLGAHLYTEVHERFDFTEITVVGVAKNMSHQFPGVEKISRRGAINPLYVSSIGMPVEQAAKCVQEMYGDFRLPHLIKYADRVAKGYSDRLFPAQNHS